MSKRTSLSNQIRGLLGEYGLIIPVGIRHVRQHLPALLEDAENALSATAREVFSALYDERVEIDKRVTHYTKRLTQLSNQHERCQQLKTLPGVGPLVATALFTAMGDPGFYKNGREFSAFLGLVPRQYSSGGKTQLKGISKRGDEHVRTLLIQGAQAALSRMPKHDDGLSRWACRVKARRGHCVAAVALANKLARISWAVAANNTTYVHKTV